MHSKTMAMPYLAELHDKVCGSEPLFFLRMVFFAAFRLSLVLGRDAACVCVFTLQL